MMAEKKVEEKVEEYCFECRECGGETPCTLSVKNRGEIRSMDVEDCPLDADTPVWEEVLNSESLQEEIATLKKEIEELKEKRAWSQ
jgi:hypothetical protein